MKEEVINYIWQYRLIKQESKNQNGDNIVIVNPGTRNFNAGPDFENARIIINGTMWAGNVEVHIKASDWFKHNHHLDNSYNNVILHVVYENDKEILRQNGEIVTCLELNGIIKHAFIKRYSSMLNTKTFPYCKKQLDSCNSIVSNSFLDKLCIHRLEEKAKHLHRLLLNYDSDWDLLSWITIIHYFGSGVNNFTFERFARLIPFKFIRSNKLDHFQIESLLFGLAGFLNRRTNRDSYYLSLQSEYRILKKGLNVLELDIHFWKYLRLRPASFPTIRISQLASLISNNQKEVHSLIFLDLKALYAVFHLQGSAYWNTHSKFGKSTAAQPKQTGKDFIHNILINAIVPLCYLYGKTHDLRFTEHSLDLLSNLPFEKNKDVAVFDSMTIERKNALHSQAILQLNQEYCSKKECLKCSIGHDLLKNSS